MDIALQCSSTLTDSVVLPFVVAVQYAHACIDPGSGSYILQLIIAGLLGLARPLISIGKGSGHRFLISSQEVRRMRMRAPSGAVPSSFRDPSGFLFFKDGSLYRQVTVIHNDNYDRLMNSGL